jgi:phage terminase Nu1 subunit (DNA packaging protein)
MTVHGLPRPEVERYVSRAQLAEHMGVSVRTVDRFVKEGMPHEDWGLKCRRFLPSKAIAWARTRGHNEEAA